MMQTLNIQSLRYRLVLASCFLICSSCKWKAVTPSEEKGEYEDFSERKLLQYQGKIRPNPEFHYSSGVLLANKLITERPDILKALLEHSKADIYIGVSGNLAKIKRFYQHGVGEHFFARLRFLEQKDLTIWARDWGPIAGYYYSQERSLFDNILIDFNYLEGRQMDDAIPRVLSDKFGAERVSIPVAFEGGNWMVDDKFHCVISDVVRESNFDWRSIQKTLSDAQIKRYFSLAGCQKISIRPRMPGEPTGHVDMAFKFIGGNRVLVGEIQSESLNVPKHFAESSLEVRDYLNREADWMKSQGYKVIRLPMPLVKGTTFRSYVNSLQLNNHFFVPSYDNAKRPNNTVLGRGISYPDDHLVAQYEIKVRSILELLDYDVSFLYAGDLIQRQGAIHCTLMNVGVAARNEVLTQSEDRDYELSFSQRTCRRNMCSYRWIIEAKPFLTDHYYLLDRIKRPVVGSNMRFSIRLPKYTDKIRIHFMETSDGYHQRDYSTYECQPDRTCQRPVSGKSYDGLLQFASSK